MKNKRYIKLIIIILIVLALDFVYTSFFNKVDAENSEVSTDSILDSQSESLRDIKFYTRS